MRFFKWSNELATGIRIIDEQHREVGRLINVFLEHCVDVGCERDDLIKTFKHLHLYCIEHFGLEEELMESYGFGGSAAHCRAHRKFRDWVEETESHLGRQDLTTGLILKINYALVEHLEVHFRTMDRRLTDHLRKVASKGADGKLRGIVSGLLGKDGILTGGRPRERE